MIKKQAGRPKSEQTTDTGIQKNVRIKPSKLAQLDNFNVLKYDSFSTYVNRLIDADLLTRIS